jgi:glycerophosphoryl diester phosphodiesterase
MAASRVEVSAHAADRTATLETFKAAVAAGADYVELDIRRTADGALVAFHDPRTAQGEPLGVVGYPRLCELAGYQVPLAADVLAAIKGGAKGHLDLKDAGREDEVARLALDVLGPGQFIITTLEDRSVAALSARTGRRDRPARPVTGPTRASCPDRSSTRTATAAVARESARPRRPGRPRRPQPTPPC